jgi:hypothetical protein
VRGSGGSANSADGRTREGEGCSWFASKGEQGEGKRGAEGGG